MLAMIARSSSKDKSKKWASAEEEEEADAANMNDSADDEGTTSSRGTTSADDDVHKGGGGKKKKQDQHQDDKGGEQKKKKKRVAVAAAAYGDDDDDDDDEHNNESALNSKWEESFQRLMAFREKHGHCLGKKFRPVFVLRKVVLLHCWRGVSFPGRIKQCPGSARSASLTKATNSFFLPSLCSASISVPNRYPEDPQLGSWGKFFEISRKRAISVLLLFPPNIFIPSLFLSLRVGN